MFTFFFSYIHSLKTYWSYHFSLVAKQKNYNEMSCKKNKRKLNFFKLEFLSLFEHIDSQANFIKFMKPES